LRRRLKLQMLRVRLMPQAQKLHTKQMEEHQPMLVAQASRPHLASAAAALQARRHSGAVVELVERHRVTQPRR